MIAVHHAGAVQFFGVRRSMARRRADSSDDTGFMSIIGAVFASSPSLIACDRVVSKHPLKRSTDISDESGVAVSSVELVHAVPGQVPNSGVSGTAR